VRYIWRSPDTQDIPHAAAARQVMHIQLYTATGAETMDSICGRGPAAGFDRTINAPFALGRRVCKFCERRAAQAQAGRASGQAVRFDAPWGKS